MVKRKLFAIFPGLDEFADLYPDPPPKDMYVQKGIPHKTVVAMDASGYFPGGKEAGDPGRSPFIN